VYEARVTLGRHGNAPVQFDRHRERHISRQHASLEWQAGQVTLLPLSTKQPTYGNGHSVKGSRVLQDGDRIQLARNGPVLRFQAGAGSSQTVPLWNKQAPGKDTHKMANQPAHQQPADPQLQQLQWQHQPAPAPNQQQQRQPHAVQVPRQLGWAVP
jgi:hypothetical protein